MSSLIINIGWEYFLGIVSGLVVLTWYASGRFSKITTEIDWIKIALKELKTFIDNTNTPAFAIGSPVNLTAKGLEWLSSSGLNTYVDQNFAQFMADCGHKRDTNPYDLQQFIFDYFDNLDFDLDFEQQLKRFAFSEGTTMNIMRRIAAIHFRNLCFQETGIRISEIDKKTS